MTKPSTSAGRSDNDTRDVLDLVNLLETYLIEIKETSAKLFDQNEGCILDNYHCDVKRTPSIKGISLKSASVSVEYSKTLSELQEMGCEFQRLLQRVEKKAEGQQNVHLQNLFKVFNESLILCNTIIRKSDHLLNKEITRIEILDSVLNFQKQITFELLLIENNIQRYGVPSNIIGGTSLERMPGQMNLATGPIPSFSEECITDIENLPLTASEGETNLPIKKTRSE